VSRRGVAVAAGCVAVAVAAAVVTVVAVRDEGGPATTTAGATSAGTTTAGTAPGTATGPGVTTPELPPAAPPVPAWGDFPGAPPDIAPPPGGSASVEPVAGGTAVTVRRPDGSVLAVATVDEATDALADARFFGPRGRLRVVVSALRVPPAAAAGGTVGARVRCGSAASANAGFRWTAFPIAWRLNSRALPARIGRSAARGAIRRARGVWNGNRSHCRTLPDLSRARFAFRGSTTRHTGRDGRNVVEFGDTDGIGGVCRGSVACTITWTNGARAIESDTRLDREGRGGYFTGTRRRGLDLQSVMVHESGHTLGFSHVSSREVVMFPFIAPRTIGGRILGRGDALANNAKY
jgi:Matrixin